MNVALSLYGELVLLVSLVVVSENAICAPVNVNSQAQRTAAIGETLDTVSISPSALTSLTLAQATGVR
jgi:hypothetical protein